VNRTDPISGLTAGAETMRHYLDVWDGDVRKAMASYNCGLGRVQSLVNAHGANWEAGLPAETRSYLSRNLNEPVS
jgi:soluble lytic murein transglycosylase-like protein